MAEPRLWPLRRRQNPTVSAEGASAEDSRVRLDAAKSNTESGPGRVEARNVSMTFETRRATGLVEALADVTVSIEPGEFVSLVGPSGCGKSTMLKIMAGLLQPTQGEIIIDGVPVKRPRRSVGIMFQTPELFPWRNVLENVLLPIDIFGHDRDYHAERARQLLRMVGLSAFEKAYPRELSGGMQQRTALSRVLVADPAIILMDEPFGALDEFTRERLNLELLRIWEEARKTVVFVTHNIGEAVFLSDRVVVMDTAPGRVDGTVTVPLARPRTVQDMKDPAYTNCIFEIREYLGVER